MANERPFRRVCVYCGSSSGERPGFLDAAVELGTVLATRGIGVVYGGGNIGLMKEVANAALAAGGEVIGVIPEKLMQREIAHDSLSELFVVDGMHSRKLIMATLSDAFIALPGGWGTLEEVFEAVTWTQLGYHNKPVGLLNVGGFYDDLISFLDRVHTHGFIANRRLLLHDSHPEQLLDRLCTTPLPAADRYIDEP